MAGSSGGGVLVDQVQSEHLDAQGGAGDADLVGLGLDPSPLGDGDAQLALVAGVAGDGYGPAGMPR
ncbi:MAG TPA: hypothetical protein VGK17_10490 [Propionicimonas sp.]